MQFDEFINSTKKDAPPQSLSEPLQAMWYARKGDWETAHNIAESIGTELGSWIHAYMHRVEGEAMPTIGIRERANRHIRA